MPQPVPFHDDGSTPARCGVLTLSLGALGTNCHLFWDAVGREAAIIDPGDESGRILDAVNRLRLKPEVIINTHGHGDHIGANGAVRTATGARLLIHAEDCRLLADASANLSSSFGPPLISPPADGLLTDGQQLNIGRLRMQVLSTPGHTPGSVCLFGEGLLFSGDTLFAGSVGRTDFPGGDPRRLEASLRRLRSLPAGTRVYPGHGPSTDLEREFASNPFFQEGFFYA